MMSNRILVADDSDTVRRVICTCLTEQNLHVCGDAIDGEDTIEKAWKLKPDLVLLDLARQSAGHSAPKELLLTR
jgi:chemotaxis response regulator CheB